MLFGAFFYPFSSDTIYMDTFKDNARWAFLKAFTEKNCDRFSFIKEFLERVAIPFSVLHIDDKKHFYIQFNKTSYTPMFNIKTVIAHYDRDENSPGANDNSASVFQLIDWARQLSTSIDLHNVRIILTDGEELGSAKEQGAYGIASVFNRLGIKNDSVYVLDGCGRGEVLVVSSTGKNAPGNSQFRKKFSSLYEESIALARAVAPESWITVPVPYSDNAGFIAAGIPAIALTVLPKDEATAYMRTLQKERKFEKEVLAQRADKTKLPKTWNLMHSEGDTIESLTDESFDLMASFLDALAKHKSIA